MAFIFAITTAITAGLFYAFPDGFGFASMVFNLLGFIYWAFKDIRSERNDQQ